MQQPEIDSAVFCDGAHYTIISRENSNILTCPVTSGAGGYTLNRVEGRDIDREIDRLTGHAACIAVDVPTWCRIAGDPLDAVANALADLLTEAPTRFELERLAAASPVLTANTPGIPVFPAGIAPAANSYTLAGCCRSALVLRLRGHRRGPENHMREVPAGADGAKRLADAALAASCATLSPNTADPCLVARLAAEARERSLSLTDPETQARGAKRAAGSTARGEAAGRGPAL